MDGLKVKRIIKIAVFYGKIYIFISRASNNVLYWWQNVVGYSAQYSSRAFVGAQKSATLTFESVEKQQKKSAKMKKKLN
jgi:hypothetical protein